MRENVPSSPVSGHDSRHDRQRQINAKGNDTQQSTKAMLWVYPTDREGPVGQIRGSLNKFIPTNLTDVCDP